MSGNVELNYTLEDLEVISAMRDFGRLVYGKCSSKMIDDDP